MIIESNIPKIVLSGFIIESNSVANVLHNPLILGLTMEIIPFFENLIPIDECISLLKEIVFVCRIETHGFKEYNRKIQQCF